MPYTSYLVRQRLGLRHHDPETRAQLGERFKAMRLNLGWDRATCAKNFHITERTLHNWETGKNDIPYTAYRLLRLLNGMELPGESWARWYFAGGTLYTPEGYPLTGKDGSWWSLLVRRAAMFDEMVRGRGGATAAGGMRSVSPALAGR